MKNFPDPIELALNAVTAIKWLLFFVGALLVYAATEKILLVVGIILFAISLSIRVVRE